MMDSYDMSHVVSQSVSHLLSSLLPAAARTLLQDLRLVLALVLILRGGAAGGGLGGGRARCRRGGESSTLYLLTATGHVCHLWSVVSLLSWSAGPLWTVGHHDTQPVRLLLLYGSASWGATVTSRSMLPIIFSLISFARPRLRIHFAVCGLAVNTAELKIDRIHVNKTRM